MFDTECIVNQGICIYNDDSNTLRIEYDEVNLAHNDTIVGISDTLTIKVFITYICKNYPATGTNSTSLTYNETRTIYNDINLFMVTFDELQDSYTIDELMDKNQWIVK